MSAIVHVCRIAAGDYRVARVDDSDDRPWRIVRVATHLGGPRWFAYPPGATHASDAYLTLRDAVADVTGTLQVTR